MTTGGGQVGGDDMEHRVGALEKSVGRIEDKLDRLIEEFREFRQDVMVRFARIEEKLETKASAVDLAEIKEKLETRASAIERAEIKGRVSVLPTIFQMISLVFGILGGAFLILKFGLPHGP